MARTEDLRRLRTGGPTPPPATPPFMRPPPRADRHDLSGVVERARNEQPPTTNPSMSGWMSFRIPSSVERDLYRAGNPMAAFWGLPMGLLSQVGDFY